MEVWNNRLLVGSSSWSDVNKTADNVRALLVNRLVRQAAIPASEGITYWGAVPRSLASTALFYVQSAPIMATNLVLQPRELGIAGLRSAIGTEWARWTSTKPAGLLVSIVAQFRGLGRTFGALAREVSQRQTRKLETQRTAAAERIGRLLLATRSGPDSAMFVSELAGAQGLSGGCRTPEEAVALLQKMLDETPAETSVVPNWLTRWWPALAIGLLAVYKLQGSWSDVVSWLRGSVWTTVEAFVQNWVVEPLFQIYLTIRHDPTEKTGLIAKESLPSDRHSLERMVVDFARDMNSQLSAADLQKIGASALNGNMDPVMAVYERQIGSPLLNLIAGDLIRAMLIQLQKSKVDVEVALSGIDQLLQSQQLVFGLVAAVPAFGVVWWLTSVLTSRLYELTYGWRASKSARNTVFAGLQWLDLVIQSTSTEKLSIEEVGLIYCGIVVVRDAIRRQDSAAQQQLWQSLDRIEGHTIARDASAVLYDMDRLYSRYMAVKMQF